MRPQDAGLMIVFGLIGIGIGILIGCVILRAACWLYNQMANTHPRPNDGTSPYGWPTPMGPPGYGPPQPFAPQPYVPPNPFGQPHPPNPQAYVPASQSPFTPSPAAPHNPYSAPQFTDPGPMPYYPGYGEPQPHPDGVPEPGWGLAAGIVIVTVIVGGVVEFLYGTAIRGIMPGIIMRQDWGMLIGLAGLRLAIGMLAWGGILAGMLKVSFLRGILVALLQVLIWIMIFVVIYAFVFAAVGFLR